MLRTDLAAIKIGLTYRLRHHKRLQVCPWNVPETVAAKLHRDPKSLLNLSDKDLSVAILFNQLPSVSCVPQFNTSNYTAPILLASQIFGDHTYIDHL